MKNDVKHFSEQNFYLEGKNNLEEQIDFEEILIFRILSFCGKL